MTSRRSRSKKTADVSRDSFEQFVNELPRDDCRYAVYDFKFTAGKAGKREQLIFIVWCPDIAKVKTKMLYAASKDALKKKLVGINHEIQGTDIAELDAKNVTEKIILRMVK